MGAFDFTNFERQGNIDNDIQLNGIDEIKTAILKKSADSLRSLKIYTPDLEHVYYSTEEFRQNLLGFTRGNRHAQIQILVDDLSKALEYGHLLIPLAQQLTSAMTIKNTPDDYLGTNISFIVFDQKEFIFKPDRHHQYAIASECSNRATKLLEFFTPAWEQAEPDVHARRLTI